MIKNCKIWIDQLTEFRDRCIQKAAGLVSFLKHKTGYHPYNNSISFYTTDKLLEDMTCFSESIKIACESTEPHFIKLGESLQGIYDDTTCLTRRTVDNVEHISGKSEQSVLVKIDRLVNRSLTEIDNYKQDVSRKLGHIQTIIVLLKELTGKCAVIEKIAKFLRVVGFNIGVECTRSSAAQEIFSVVADSIRQLAARALDLSKIITEDTIIALQSQEIAYSEIFNDFNRSLHLVSEVRESVDKTAVEIENLISLVKKVLEGAGENSEVISGQIGEIVMGIQFHDNMSQRIGHIIESVKDASDLCREQESTVSREEKHAALHTILSIQAAQLRQIITEINAVYRKNKKSFSEILTRIEMTGKSLAGISDTEKASDTPIIRLTHALEEIHELLSTRDELVKHLGLVAGQASDMTAKLSSHINHIHNINFEAHKLALNAIIKAAKVGEKGRTLEVLAQEIKRLSEQSGDFVHEVEKIILPVTSSASLLQDTANVSKKAGSDATQLLKEGIKDIADTYAVFDGNAADTFHMIESVEAAVKRVGVDLDFLPVLSDDLSVCLAQLEEITGSLNYGQQKGCEMPPALEHLLARYTMEEERDIHEQILSGVEPLKLEFQEENEDVALFELFEPENSAAVEVRDDTGGVEIFDVATVEEKEKNDTFDDELGDNIELF